MLTKKVPKGNADGKLFCIYLEARNLDMLPRNPPVPTSNSVLIIMSRKGLTKVTNIFILMNLMQDEPES